MTPLLRLPRVLRHAEPPARRETYRAFLATVVAVEDLTPRMRRVTLRAPQLADYRRVRADDFFALLIPGDGGIEIPGDEITAETPRGVAELIPEAQRPTLRWYTIRAHRPSSAEIDVDIVLHGSGLASGPGSTWATHARPGDAVGIAEGNGVYNPVPDAERQLFFADITALPALISILESADPAPGRPRPGTGSIAHIEVPSEEDVTEIATDVDVRWHVRGTERTGFSVPRILDGVDGISYAWLCAEADMVKRARRLVSGPGGVSKSAITFSGYWRHGQARS